MKKKTSIPHLISAHDQPIRVLREELGLSQRELSDRLGTSKTSLLRLERKGFDQLTITELLTVSKGLDFDVDEVIRHFKSSHRKEGFKRTSLKNPYSVTSHNENIQIGTLLESSKDVSISNIQVKPQEEIPYKILPQGNLVFCLVVEGKAFLSLFGNDHILKMGECFSFEGPISYQLHNPDMLKIASLLFVVAPSLAVI